MTVSQAEVVKTCGWFNSAGGNILQSAIFEPETFSLLGSFTCPSLSGTREREREREGERGRQRQKNRQTDRQKLGRRFLISIQVTVAIGQLKLHFEVPVRFPTPLLDFFRL